jgi:hypothetical protein
VIPKQRGEPFAFERWIAVRSTSELHQLAAAWPEVFEFEEVFAGAVEATVREIVAGAVYRGLGGDNEPDPPLTIPRAYRMNS